MSDNAPNKTQMETPNKTQTNEIDWSTFHIGIPCKFSEIAIIPKHIYDVVENEIICKCRGGELVLLELVEEYTSNEAINAALSELFGIGIDEYISIWEKRVDAENLRKNGWVKVRMRKI